MIKVRILLFVLLFLLVYCNQRAEFLKPPIQSLDDQSILSNLYSQSVIINDSTYHIQKHGEYENDDGYLENCTKYHVHRYLHAFEKNEAGFQINDDSCYSKILKKLPIGNDTNVVIIETVPLDYTCHACAPSLSIAMYILKRNKWQLCYMKEHFVNIGGFGRTPVYPIEYIKLGKKHIGIVFKSGFSGQGYSQAWINIFSFVNNEFVSVWNTNVAQDNSGACDEENGITCWAESTSYKFETGGNPEWYDIHTYTSGNTDSTTTIMPNRPECRYVFNGIRFVPHDSLTFYSSQNIVTKKEQPQSSNLQDASAEKDLPQTLKIKDFYLGMDLKAACVLINSKYADIFGTSEITQNNDTSSENKHFKQVIKCASSSAEFWGDSKNEVSKFYWPSEVVNQLFNVSDMNANDFAQEFINAYNIPKLEYGQKNIFAFITIVPVNFWYYKSPTGYTITILDASPLGENLSAGKSILLEKTPKSKQRTFD